jgi:hypothetical protein
LPGPPGNCPGFVGVGALPHELPTTAYFWPLHQFDYIVKPKPACEMAGFRWSSLASNQTLHALATHLLMVSLLP